VPSRESFKITAQQSWRKTVRHHSRDGEPRRVQIEEQEKFLAAPACDGQAGNEDNFFFPTLKIAAVGVKLRMSRSVLAVEDEVWER
jgi:hypothetical protein